MANWWDKNLTDKQKFRLQEPKDPSLLDVVSTVPNPVGDVASGLLASQDLSKGNYGSAALNSLGLLPFIPSMGAMLKDVGKAPLSELEQTILNGGGATALQRFKKAKSLVPDLESQYTSDALRNLFTQSEKYGLTVMKPSEFENFASPLGSHVESIKKYSKKSIDDTDYASYPDYMEYLKEVSQNTGFKDVPFLHLNKEEAGLPLNPFISGHEGRHRTRAQAELGDVPTLVELRLRGDLYPSLPKENYIDALNKEMAYNDLIYPQPAYIDGKDVPRIPRKLPNEIFGAALIPTAGLLDTKEKKKEKKTK